MGWAGEAGAGTLGRPARSVFVGVKGIWSVSGGGGGRIFGMLGGKEAVWVLLKNVYGRLISYQMA